MPALYAQLSSDSLLHFSGGQVPTFLQGQLTCDCLQLSEAQSAQGALCNAQGRVVTDCRVLCLGDTHYALRLRSDVRDITHTTLEKYAMFSRTQISERDGEWTLLGLWGPDAAAVLRSIIGGTPDGRDRCLATDAAVACQADDAGEAFELLVTHTAIPDVRAALASQASECPEAHWQQNELRRGLVRTTAELSGNHVPQALNYDLAGLLNWRKGCYIGQEVVARLHYKGKSKRRCGVYSTAQAADLESGATLATEADDRAVGSVLRIIRAAGEPSLVLALITVADSELPLTVKDADTNGPHLQPAPLPYSLRGSSEAS